MGALVRLCLSVGRVYVGVKGLWGLVVALGIGWIGSAVVEALGGPWLLGSLISIVMVVAIYIYLGLPRGSGIHTPRYLRWYENPARLVSFKFDNYLGLSAKAGKDLGIGRFQAQMRVNRDAAVEPMEAFIESNNMGTRSSVKFRTPMGYKEAAEVERIPKGQYYWISCDFEGLKEKGTTIPVEDFLQAYSGFDLVLRWRDRSFRRRFSRSDIEMVIDSFRKHSNPPPPPQIVTRTRGLTC